MSLHTLRNIAWLAPLTLLAACAQTTPLSYRTPIMVPAIERPSAETSSWWFRAGAASAAEAITANGITSNNTAPKNIILFLGDGMSLSTITAAHILAGQRLNLDGESYRLSFEKFPYTALSRTYETDQQTPDSAGTMTAIMSGVKTKSGFIGTGQQAKRGDCASAHNQELVSTLELAKAAGLAVGVVTTTTITHATPAATYGHVPDRAWEADANMPEQARLQGCK
ncbi:MAG: alkaline phosphatase, partial [Ottowia sp.]|nr:alkaline phosphatase [Ottowia sp.]